MSETLLRIYKFKLELGADTYQNSTYEGEVEADTKVVEFRKTSSLNDPNLVKKGNFYTWNFEILRLHEDDATWETMVSDIATFAGKLITFTPDTVDNPTENLQCYFWSKLDKISQGGAGIEKIYIEVIRLYSEGNEV